MQIHKQCTRLKVQTLAPWLVQEGEYLAHGGGGIILSVGLMRMLPTSYMLVGCTRKGEKTAACLQQSTLSLLECAVGAWY